MHSIDPVTAEILRNKLSAIVHAMSARLAANAVSPQIVEGRAFSTALLDENGAVAFIDNATHLASIELTAKSVLDKFAFDMQPGDVFLTNDPYGGGSHLLDFTLVSSLAVDMEPVVMLAVRAKMPDIGGEKFGGLVPGARELWAEGARLTPIRVYRDDKMLRDALATVLINSRCEETLKSNIAAMMLALRLGGDMFVELIRGYGLNSVRSAMRYAMDYSERCLRKKLSEWPDGIQTGRYYIDHDGTGRKGLKVEASVRLERGSIEIDFSGSDLQSQSFVNATYGDLCSYSLLPILELLQEEVPRNSGLLRPIKFSAPKGSLVNPSYPSAVGFSPWYPAATVATAVARALAGFVGNDSPNPTMHALLIRSIGKDGSAILDHDQLGVGSCSASSTADGWGVPPSYCRGLMPSIELYERSFSGRVESIEYEIDSGGPGEHRGGLGTRTTLYFEGDQDLMVILQGRRFTVPGCAGGSDGSSNEAWLFDTHGEKVVEDLYLGRDVGGKSCVFILGGGGGWGNPLERSPCLVLEDYLNEVVSRAAAAEQYGVIFTSDGRAVLDEEATARQRHSLQRDRKDVPEQQQ